MVLWSLGLSPAPAAPPPPSVEAAQSKIAPWVLAHTANGQLAEFQVVLTQQADLSWAAALPTKAAKGRYVYNTLYTLAQATQKPLIDLLKARGAEYRSYYLVNLIWVKGDQALALELAARSDVARIDANPQIHLDLPEAEAPATAPLAPNAIEPGLTNVGAPTVWAMGYTGQGVVVAGQDTGYRWTHNALQGKYRGWNGSAANHDYNWHDSIHSGGGSCGADVTQPCDDFGHGTHTMGTVAGDDGGNNQIGMAPGAKWMGCRNMDQGNGTPTTYLECFEFFVAPYPVTGTVGQGNPALAPDVTNNSWGCPTSEGCNSGNWDTMRQAIANSRAAGIMTVASAGNAGSACGTVNDPPAMFDESYSIGAYSSGTNVIASFSSRGPVTVDGSNRPKPDISAPGVSVRSALNSGDNSYTSYSGTSMAGPHVVGAVALLWSASPNWANQIDMTEKILNFSATHVSVANTCSSNNWPNNVYGFGRLNIAAAVQVGVVAGVVRNAVTTAPVANATVLINGAYTNVTTGAGLYELLGYSGTVTITASAPGYFPLSLTNVVITRGQTLMRDLLLQPAIYGAALTSPNLAQNANPGQMVAYSFLVTNTGNITDSFSLQTTGGTFTNTLQPTALGPLAPSASGLATVTVYIPSGALAGTQSVAQLTATSQGSPATQAAKTFTTTVNAVPSVALGPQSLAQNGRWGEVVAYTLWVTNTGNIADTYTVTVSGAVFTTTPSVSTLGPLAPGASLSFTVNAQIPWYVQGSDSATAMVTSQLNGSVTANASLQTTVIVFNRYLPYIGR